ncbi:MAG: hypothetical protein Q7T57_02435 [Dehalococcoidales bacterium]|nr:hypothetical protein [Dehalococcoidales bacterium]
MAKGPPFHSGPLATHRKGPVSSNVRPQIPTISLYDTMGLKGDLDEAVKDWPKSNRLIKAWLVFSVFFSTLQLASLSEAVFKWKGFVLDGVNFYREWFTTPISKATAEFTGFSVAPFAMDIVFVQILSTNAVFQSVFKEKRDLPGWKPLLITMIVGNLVGLAGIIFLTRPGATGPSWMLYAFWFLFFGLAPRGKLRMNLLLHFAIPTLIVCIAAAIQLGLTKVAA